MHPADAKREIVANYGTLATYRDPGPSPGSLYLPAVKTVVYTTKKQHARHRRVNAILSAFRFRDWRFFQGTTNIPYWWDIPRDHAHLLRTLEPPLLILEDDIEPRDFCPNVSPPAESHLCYLGGGGNGDWQGVLNARMMGRKTLHGRRYGYERINSDWMRIYGMWFTHAVLWLSRDAMLEAANLLEAATTPIDTVLGRNQYRWFVSCRRVPLFWQNDGHHKRDTYDYQPRDEKKRPID